jgi:hypothetical protein
MDTDPPRPNMDTPSNSLSSFGKELATLYELQRMSAISAEEYVNLKSSVLLSYHSYIRKLNN